MIGISVRNDGKATTISHHTCLVTDGNTLCALRVNQDNGLVKLLCQRDAMAVRNDAALNAIVELMAVGVIGITTVEHGVTAFIVAVYAAVGLVIIVGIPFLYPPIQSVVFERRARYTNVMRCRTMMRVVQTVIDVATR